MYNAFFGFRKAPFASTPDADFFFASSNHEAALKGLQLSVDARMGLISLVGDEGTGKTVVLECLRKSLGPDIPCAFVREAQTSFGGFLETIALDLHLDLRLKTKSVLQIFLALTRLGTQQAQNGSTVVLIVDEAHNLPNSVFYEIVHTASMQHEKVKAIQTVFAGRPDLQLRLAAMNPDRAGQRAFLSRSLHPLTARETRDYIEFRLACAGMPKQTVFPGKVLEEIYDRSQGFAPEIHALCDRLLLNAFSITSRVCTPDMLDEVFTGPPLIDTALAVADEPEAPPMQTALLRMAVGARRGSLDPWRTISAQLPPLGASPPPVAYPRGRFTLAIVEFATAAIQPLTHKYCAQGSVPAPTRAQVSEISWVPAAEILPRLANAGPAGGRTPGTAELPAHKLIPLERYVKLALGAISTPSPLRPFGELASQELAPIYPKPSLQPAGAIPGSAVPLARVRANDSGRIDRVALHADAFPSTVGIESLSMCLATGLQPARIVPAATALPNPIGNAPIREAAEPAGLTVISLPLYPAARLQPASVIPCPRVPNTLFEPVPRVSSARQSSELEPSELISETRSTPTILSASFNPSAVVPGTLLPLAFHAQSVAPPVVALRTDVAEVCPSLYARPPRLKLKPVDPPRPGLLSPATWIPNITNYKIPWPPPANTFTGTRKRLASNLKAHLALVIPILAALAFHSAPPAMRAVGDASRQGLRSAQRAIVNRAAVALDEDFRGGMTDWTNRGGSTPSWTSDPSGFVRPSGLALYRPALPLVDYRMQFLGTIDKNGLSWVARAADFNNYYVIGLVVLKPGPLPSIGVTRYAVIHGIPQRRVTTPLLMSAQADTVYRVRLDVKGDHFALSVQDHPVDSWSEPRLGHGSVGFFSESDAASRIASLHVRGHYDMLGRLCAFFVPSSISNYR